ncbi:MAG TPA: trehalase family glycosidase [Capsulimonadaceae bacterium]|jgi:hypothetical protein
MMTNVMTATDIDTLDLYRLEANAGSTGKPEWAAMLTYVARLHRQSVLAPTPPFTRSWEEIGPGYQASPAFGHWDIVHQIIDVLPHSPAHALAQIRNNLDMQQRDGFLPGAVWMRYEAPSWSLSQTHPPVWPVAVDEYVRASGDVDILGIALPVASRQIAWFEQKRKAEGEGYYYSDILTHEWESGVDEGIRFIGIHRGPKTCVDATSHVALLYRTAAEWSERIGTDSSRYRDRLSQIERYVQTNLFDSETGFFHDSWAVGTPAVRTMAYEGIWPLVAGIATPEQAMRVIDENLLSEKRFLAPHPITTVARDDPHFELRMWRGPAWNSMTYWAARGCAEYKRWDAVRLLLERALDASAKQFELTGTIWEFYDPFGGDPRKLLRKPGTEQTMPCRDYLGHNPLIAMARLWELARRQ